MFVQVIKITPMGIKASLGQIAGIIISLHELIWGFVYVDSKGDVLQNALIKASEERSLPDRLNFSELCPCLL